MYEMVKLRRAEDPSYVSAEQMEEAVVTQFQGSKVAKLLRNNETSMRVVDIGLRAIDRRMAVINDNAVLAELVERGWQPQALATVFGFGTVYELNAWLKATNLTDVYNEATANSAEIFVDMMVSAYDNTLEIEERVLQLSADAIGKPGSSPRTIDESIAMSNEMALQTKALDAIGKMGERRAKMAERLAAIKNPSRYGAAKNANANASSGTTPVVNIQMEFGPNDAAPREVKVVNAPPQLPGNIDLG